MVYTNYLWPWKDSWSLGRPKNDNDLTMMDFGGSSSKISQTCQRRNYMRKWLGIIDGPGWIVVIHIHIYCSVGIATINHPWLGMVNMPTINGDDWRMLYGIVIPTYTPTFILGWHSSYGRLALSLCWFNMFSGIVGLELVGSEMILSPGTYPAAVQSEGGAQIWLEDGQAYSHWAYMENPACQTRRSERAIFDE